MKLFASSEFIDFNGFFSTHRVADVNVHAAKAEIFRLETTEALACGIPVVATNVGGIPEQIEQGKIVFSVHW